MKKTPKPWEFQISISFWLLSIFGYKLDPRVEVYGRASRSREWLNGFISVTVTDIK